MIEVRNLKFSYPGAEAPVLKGLDFEIRKGEIFGFLGPSGAGKSTAQKILIGALKGYEGSAKVSGQEIRRAGTDYYERIGVAFEFPNFYMKFTAMENLKLFRSLYKGETEDPERLLRQVGLEEAAHLKVSRMSKGMRMRLNFCRALLNRPEMLFLDEPTSGLDPVNASAMKEMIMAKRAEGATVLITTHNMEAARQLCDRVAFIVDGRIKLIESPRELMIRHGSKRVKVEYRRPDGKTAEEQFSLTGIGGNARFQQLLKEADIETIHSMEASLGDIFIEVTGSRLT